MSVTKFPDENRMQENVTLTKQYVQSVKSDTLFIGTTSDYQTARTSGTVKNGAVVILTDDNY